MEYFTGMNRDMVIPVAVENNRTHDEHAHTPYLVCSGTSTRLLVLDYPTACDTAKSFDAKCEKYSAPNMYSPIRHLFTSVIEHLRACKQSFRLNFLETFNYSFSVRGISICFSVTLSVD